MRQFISLNVTDLFFDLAALDFADSIHLYDVQIILTSRVVTISQRQGLAKSTDKAAFHHSRTLRTSPKWLTIGHLLGFVG